MNTLNEVSAGRRMDALAKRVVEKLIEQLKSPGVLHRIGSKQPAQMVVTAEDVGLPEGVVEYVQLDFTFDRRLGPQEISTNAVFVSGGYVPRVEVEITYPDRPFRLRDIADIYPELLENVRHELEHAMQSVSDDEESSLDELISLDDFVKYYLDKSEVSAFVSGLMSKAKTTGAPLGQLMDDKIDAILADAEDAGVSDQDLVVLSSSLRDTYFAYARKRYPRMK